MKIPAGSLIPNVMIVSAPLTSIAVPTARMTAPARAGAALGEEVVHELGPAHARVRVQEAAERRDERDLGGESGGCVRCSVRARTSRTSQTGWVFIHVFCRTYFDHLTFRFVNTAP
jgi:hypothetical protein